MPVLPVVQAATGHSCSPSERSAQRSAGTSAPVRRACHGGERSFERRLRIGEVRCEGGPQHWRVAVCAAAFMPVHFRLEVNAGQARVQDDTLPQRRVQEAAARPRSRRAPGRLDDVHLRAVNQVIDARDVADVPGRHRVRLLPQDLQPVQHPRGDVGFRARSPPAARSGCARSPCQPAGLWPRNARGPGFREARSPACSRRATHEPAAFGAGLCRWSRSCVRR